MAKLRRILLIARVVTVLMGAVAMLFAIAAVVAIQFLPHDWAWLPTWTIRIFVAITLVNVGLAISVAVLRGLSALARTRA